MDPQPEPKCLRCSAPILHGDIALRQHGEWLHILCARILSSDEHVRESKRLRRTSDATITKSRERMEKGSAFRDEPPAVLCVVCGTGIHSARDLLDTPSGPSHVGCATAPRP